MRLFNGLHEREVRGERRATTERGSHAHTSLALFDDAVHRCKSQPGSTAALLGGEERLAQTIGDLRTNAGARVDHGKPGSAARSVSRTTDAPWARGRFTPAPGEHAAAPP